MREIRLVSTALCNGPQTKECRMQSIAWPILLSTANDPYGCVPEHRGFHAHNLFTRTPMTTTTRTHTHTQAFDLFQCAWSLANSIRPMDDTNLHVPMKLFGHQWDTVFAGVLGLRDNDICTKSRCPPIKYCGRRNGLVNGFCRADRQSARNTHIYLHHHHKTHLQLASSNFPSWLACSSIGRMCSTNLRYSNINFARYKFHIFF